MPPNGAPPVPFGTPPVLLGVSISLSGPACTFGARAAAHTMLKNWGRVVEDASAALAMVVLPGQSSLRASRRGANAALKLRRLKEAVRCEELEEGVPL